LRLRRAFHPPSLIRANQRFQSTTGLDFAARRAQKVINPLPDVTSTDTHTRHRG